MNTLKIYRIEKDGIGPYAKEVMNKIQKLNPNGYQEFLSLTEDRRNIRYLFGWGNKYKEYLSGCQSIAELLNFWFGPIIKDLESLGFEIKIYIVKKDGCYFDDDGTQTFFRRSDVLEKI